MGTIDEYLATLDPSDAAIIAHTYDVAREVVPDAEQGVGYGMPALVYRGASLLSVMSAKKHFGVYPFSPAAIVTVLPMLDGRIVLAGEHCSYIGAWMEASLLSSIDAITRLHQRALAA